MLQYLWLKRYTVLMFLRGQEGWAGSWPQPRYSLVSWQPCHALSLAWPWEEEEGEEVMMLVGFCFIYHFSSPLIKEVSF